MKSATLSDSAISTFRVSVAVVIVGTEISAYDNEAACRYVREEIAEMKDYIHGQEVDLQFADGADRNSEFVLPDSIEAEAELTDGEEGDPDGDMSQAEFEVTVPAYIQFDVEVPKGTGERGVLALAAALLSARNDGDRVSFDTQCLGDHVRLSNPLRLGLVK